MRHLLPVLLLPLFVGCRGVSYRSEVSRAPLPATPAAGVVFVANGSGDFHTVCTALRQAVAETATSLQVETYVWSHGRWRYLLDHVDHANHLTHGRLLAAQVTACRQACPHSRIYLVGHSAGSAVVLAAAEMLPPESVDRIILLAPSVCETYDLRPALRSARHGIDVFHSSRDRVILGICMRIVGTAEQGCHVAAGKDGFIPVITCPTDATIYSKLRQHPWDPVVQWSGNNGGHYGSNNVGFLKAYVLPLMLGN